MNTQYTASQKQQVFYGGGLIGLGVGVILTTLFWVLLAPSSVVGASLITGGIVVAFGLILLVVPVWNVPTSSTTETDTIDVEELVKDWQHGFDGDWPQDAVDEPIGELV